ncbi:DUF2726 domain-containing protein [Yersinia ruckeri]|uniref:DUF2726 domain-containing protein n=1 Tax=Yersinia ruckeri TaxID=29486 RepID=UPI003BF5D115
MCRPAWQRCDTLMTLREQHFFRALLKNIDTRQWYLCPQVRVADIVRLGGHIRPQSRAWWQLFRMASQWHCDVVIIDKNTFGIIAAVELDDASHLQVRRVRRDILLAEVLRQAGIPLIRHHDSQILLKQINQFLQGKTKGMRQAECADI